MNRRNEMLLLIVLLAVTSSVAADSSFIRNSGSATLGGNISVGTLESKARLQVNGTIYQNAAEPRIVGYLSNPLKLNGAKNVFVQGKYAYVTAEVNDSLNIIDVSTPSLPVLISSVKDIRLNGSSDLFVGGGYAYVVSSENNSLTVVDVSNVSNPVVLGSVMDNSRLSGAESVTVSGKYAYVASLTNRSLSVIDISNPYYPNITGYVTDPVRLAAAFGVSKQGDIVFVSSRGGDSLTLVDVSNSTSPVIISSISDIRLDGARNNIISGRYAYVASGINDSLTIVDVSNISHPIIIGSVTDVRLSSARDISLTGKYALVTLTSAPRNGITIVDVSNPSSPTIAGHLNDTKMTGAFGLFVSGKYAYVASNTNHSLTIIDLGGIDSSVANIGALKTGSLSITENAIFGNNLEVGNGLFAGGADIKGKISIYHPFPDNTSNSTLLWVGSNASSAAGSTALQSPKTTGILFNEWSSPDEAFGSNDVYAVANSDGIQQDYHTFELPVPVGVIIDGIEVRIEALSELGGDSVDVELSWNANDFTSSGYTTGALSISDTVYTIGGSTDTWGRTWSPSEFSNANFMVKIRANQGLGNALYVDHIQVRVHYSMLPLVAVFGGGTGKIDVGTVDPVYTINGRQYATYLPAMTGVKEETTGTLELTCNSDLCSEEIDFSDLEEGSDLWLFSKTTSLKKNFDNMVVLLTPSFKGRVWYEKDDNKLRIYARKFAGSSNEVSYRLTAPRFDHEQWTNYNIDGSTGFFIE